MSVFQAWFTSESIRFRVRALKARFRDQKAEFDIISRHIRPGDVVCDIGANKGGFIYWLSGASSTFINAWSLPSGPTATTTSTPTITQTRTRTGTATSSWPSRSASW